MKRYYNIIQKKHRNKQNMKLKSKEYKMKKKEKK